MKAVARIVAGLAIFVALLGISSIEAGRGGGQPAPPPPVLCGCVCPDGSFVTTHAPDENSCATACEAACSQTS